MNDNIALTVVSFGAGQDTFYFLTRIILDLDFRKKHIQGRLLVLGSDTGNEHPHTYEAIEFIKKMCQDQGVEFYWITADMGFHPNTWQSLTFQYTRNRTIGSAAYQQTCTDNLKIKPLYNFLEQWLLVNYNYDFRKTNKKGKLTNGKGKKVFHAFAKDHGKIRVILGFAKNEEGRCSNAHATVWQRASLVKYYPLILDGTDRQAAIDYNEANIPFTVFPSNCMFCFYQSDQEILWLFRFHPKRFFEWVDIEHRKLQKNAAEGVVKNLGVYGKGTLLDKLDKAQKLYGHWTDEQLNEYKYSHGHCIKSKY